MRERPRRAWRSTRRRQPHRAGTRMVMHLQVMRIVSELAETTSSPTMSPTAMGSEKDVNSTGDDIDKCLDRLEELVRSLIDKFDDIDKKQ
ncbi:hypothetical protein GUJ93_ZPchr0008g11839 [Zizania palustris]|uniref:Uncharacterized protein n=1 Tax=Zizania palustris TaxID=103762 RepID=A0A8J5RIN3_ZIZPA|nr:hypothetical protein GUJ93_ZPchr0008g11839 [Zizania palustris]